MVKKWIQKALRRKGSLRAYVKKKFGKRGFTKSKKTSKLVIKVSVLNKLAKLKGTIGAKARLALKLREFKKRTKKTRKRKKR